MAGVSQRQEDVLGERAMKSNKITGPNAGGPRQFSIQTPLAAPLICAVRTKEEKDNEG